MVTTADLAREIKRRNPDMTLEEIGRICGVTKQAVSKHLQNPVREVPQPRIEAGDSVCRTCKRHTQLTPIGDCYECVMWHTRFWRTPAAGCGS